VIWRISWGGTSHQTGTVPLCSMTGATSWIDRTSIAVLLLAPLFVEGSRRPGAGIVSVLVIQGERP